MQTLFIHGFGGAPEHWDAVRSELPPRLRGDTLNEWAKNPNARNSTFPSAGHYLAQEQPSAVAIAIEDFLLEF